MIRKPIGSRLPSCELPGGSFVNAEVVESEDGAPHKNLVLHYCPGSLPSTGIEISESDIRAILEWACRS